MSQETSPSSGRAYGLARVARVWGVSRATLYRHRQTSPAASRRPGPIGPMPDDDLVVAIRGVLTASAFHGEGYRKVWARLRFAGVRTSRRRVLRLMHQHNLGAHQRTGRARGPRSHDGTIMTQQVDTMWGTDLTSVMTGEGLASVFIAVDHCSAECFGGFGRGIAAGLMLRHDHGSQYVSDAFQREIAFLGMISSPAFVRAPEGNGCAERFIRTLKENLLWVRDFDTVEELRLALLDFRRRYNETWILERHGYRTPTAIRAAQIQPAALAA